MVQASPVAQHPVSIWLFGELAAVAPERPLRLQMDAGFTPGRVVAELVERYGGAFRDRVIDPDGRLNGCCRICVDGEMVADLDAPVTVQGPETEIEFILLWATEGG